MKLEKDTTQNRLRAWADDADQHGNHWVPVSPTTLRMIAEDLDEMEESLQQKRELLAQVRSALLSWGVTVSSVDKELGRSVEEALQRAQKCADAFARGVGR